MINALMDQRTTTATAFEHDHIAPLIVIDVHDTSALNQPPTLALAAPRYVNQDILRFCIRYPDVSRMRLVGPTFGNRKTKFE